MRHPDGSSDKGRPPIARAWHALHPKSSMRGRTHALHPKSSMRGQAHASHPNSSMRPDDHPTKGAMQ